MRRMLPAFLVALVVCASVWPCGGAASAQRRRRPSGAGAARASAANRMYDARVAQIADAYVRGHYAFNPSEGTAAGLHDFDSKLEERDASAVAAEARRLRGVLAELARVPEWR